MKNLLLLLLFIPITLQAQFPGTLQQFFDGNDTIPSQRLNVVIDQPANNVWVIGPPNKTIFNAAATLPNAIFTKDSTAYPVSDTSSFSLNLTDTVFNFGGIVAINWKQKIDLENGVDGGLIEFSVDTGKNWTNVFGSMYTYNFFGFNPSNVDTLFNNQLGFTGTDTNWRDIWLCFDGYWLSQYDSVQFRYKLLSDSVQTNQEGWLIDNMSLRPTIIHTINEKERSEYIKLNPNPASDYTSIDLKKQKGEHFIKHVMLYDMKGQLIRSWGLVPNRFKVPLDGLEAGNYLLHVETNIKTEVHQVVVID